MKWMTVTLPDELAALPDLEPQRRDVSAATIIREARTAYLEATGLPPKRLRFAAVGRSGYRETAQEAETILARDWG